MKVGTGLRRPQIRRFPLTNEVGACDLGIGATSSQYRELLADQWSFLLWQFGDPGFQPKQGSVLSLAAFDPRLRSGAG